MKPGFDPKICPSCGRSITWRKKWEKTWEQVKYCSAGCRSRKTTDTDRALESVMLELLTARARDATICPSEVARHVGGEAWRDLMEPARRAARRLVSAGCVVITQRGRIVDASTARGPIRVRRA